MAILNLWINSAEMNLTAESCWTLLQAIDKAAEAAVHYQVGKMLKMRMRTYETGWLKIAGVTVPKKFWPKLKAACQQVIEGFDVRFQVGWRVCSTVLTHRLSHNPYAVLRLSTTSPANR